LHWVIFGGKIKGGRQHWNIWVRERTAEALLLRSTLQLQPEGSLAESSEHPDRRTKHPASDPARSLAGLMLQQHYHRLRRQLHCMYPGAGQASSWGRQTAQVWWGVGRGFQSADDGAMTKGLANGEAYRSWSTSVARSASQRRVAGWKRMEKYLPMKAESEWELKAQVGIVFQTYRRLFFHRNACLCCAPEPEPHGRHHRYPERPEQHRDPADDPASSGAEIATRRCYWMCLPHMMRTPPDSPASQNY